MNKPTDDPTKAEPVKVRRDTQFDEEECKMEEEEEPFVISDPVKRQGESGPNFSSETNRILSTMGKMTDGEENGPSKAETVKKEGPRVTEDDGDDDDESTTTTSQPHTKNPDLEDWKKTGRWGSVSKTEVLIVMILVILIAAGVTVAVVILVGGNADSSGGTTTTGFVDHGNDQTEKLPKLSMLNQEQLIHSVLQEDPLLQTVWDDNGDDLTNPYRLAANWVVYEDPVDYEGAIVPRFALAVLYYATGGKDNHWIRSDGWLTDLDVCDGWYGVECDVDGNIVNLELRGNGLMGEMPLALVLLPTLQALWFDENKMTGRLPADVFPRLTALQFLYVQYNQFTGPIPETMLDNGNQLREYCMQTFPSTNTTILFGFLSYTLFDCKNVQAPFSFREIPSRAAFLPTTVPRVRNRNVPIR